MSWLDAIAPQWALRRQMALAALKQLRAYDAAKTPRKWQSWQRPVSGPRTEANGAGDRLRASVRDLLRNNGYAQRAHRTLVRSTVGTGILGTPMQGDRPASRPTRDAWDRWVDGCDFDGHHDLYGLQMLAARTAYESGEALVRFYRQSDFSSKVAPVRVQILEPDFIDTNRFGGFGRAETGNWVDRGIEYDELGRKVALWLHRVHPGDQSRYLLSKFESVRVPVGEVVQVYDMLRPGQDRGVSIFAGAVAPLKDLGDYFEAELMRKRIEACLSVFVTAPESGDTLKLGLANGTDGASGAEMRQLVPGMITRLNPGESVTSVAPSASPEIKQFADQILLLAAAAGGVMFEHMTGNFEKVNYSSYRVGSHDFAGWVEQQQWLVFNPRLCRPIASAFNQAATAAGLIAREAQIRWTPPPAVTSPDPMKDANADEKNLRLGAIAPSDLAERRGFTYAEQLDRIAADLKQADEKGIQFDGDPRKNLKGSTDAGSSNAGAPAAAD
jgi:lambda family phage portal protein